MPLIALQPDCPSAYARQAAAAATVRPERQPEAIVLDETQPREHGRAGV